MMFEELQRAIVSGNEDRARGYTAEALRGNADPKEILNEGLLRGMDEVGQRFKAYEMYLPEVIMSASAMKTSMELLRPLLSRSGVTSLGKIVMATVEGDVHDIGKNLVSMMLEGAGFEIVDLGVDVQVDTIVKKAVEEEAHIVGLSALLTTTMMALGGAVGRIKGKVPGTRVMVGGAPLTKEFAQKVGADGFAPDALRAIHLAKTLVGKA
jgi:5-methyltetrahydrofolate--homocysteine methyltransferase